MGIKLGGIDALGLEYNPIELRQYPDQHIHEFENHIFYISRTLKSFPHL